MNIPRDIAAKAYRKLKEARRSLLEKQSEPIKTPADTVPVKKPAKLDEAAPQAAAPAQQKRKDPKLSVIVPAYNVDDYLEECINSILVQDYGDFEVVIVDDGSPGKTPLIADRLAEKDGRITVIHQENAGLGAARNKGILCSSAPYLTFIDSDDTIPQHAFKSMMDSLHSSGSDIAVGSIARFNSTRTWTPFWVNLVHDIRRQGITAKELPPIMWDVFACNKIFKRTTWDSIVGTFPVGTLYEDQESTAKLFVNDATLDILPEVVYNWRLREDGQSITQNKSNIDDLKQRLKVAEETRKIVSSYTQEYTDYWFTKCLGEDFFYYYREVPRTDLQFFEALQNGIRDFFDKATPKAISDIAPVRRWMAYFTAVGNREGLIKLLVHLDEYRTYFSAKNHGEEIIATIPDLEEVLDSIPEELRIASSDHFDAQALITNIESDQDGSLIISGMAYIPNYDEDIFVSLELRGDSSTIGPFRATMTNGAPLQITADPYNWHSRSAFTVMVPASSLDAELESFDSTETDEYHILLNLSNKHQKWSIENPKRSGDGPAAWPTVGNLTAKGARYVIIGDPASNTKVKFLQPRFILDDFSQNGRHYEVHISINDTANLRNTNLFDLSAAAVSVKMDGNVLLSVPAKNVGRSIHAEFEIPRSVCVDSKKFSQLLSLEVVCDSRRRSAVAVKKNILQDNLRDKYSLCNSGYGYAQINISCLSSFAESIEYDETSDSLIISGQALIDPEHIRTHTPSFSLVRKGHVINATRVEWNALESKFKTYYSLVDSTNSYRDRGLPDGRYILQVLLPTKQQRPATSWVPCTDDLMSHLPLELETSHHTVKLTAIGKSRTVQVQLTGSGNTTENRSAVVQRHMSQKYFRDTARAVSNNAVLFESFGGNSVSDSPRELDRIISDKYPEVVRYWSVRDSSIVVPDGAVPLVVGTDAWMKALATSRVLVNNNNFPHYFRKGVNQYYIQTWHGTPLKQIGNDVPPANLSLRYRSLMKKEAEKEWDLLLAQAEWSGKTLSSAFGYSGEVFANGYPRNDSLNDPERALEANNRVRDLYDIPANNTVVLYAPTWRDNLKDASGRYSRVYNLDLQSAVKKLGSKFTILYRGHANSLNSNAKDLPAGVIDVSAHTDVNDLISTSDMMITDYSSIMFDYVTTGKPISFLVPDLEQYRDSTRGFYFNFEESAPGPLFRSTPDTIDWIQRTANSAFDADFKYAEFRSSFAPFDDGKAGERLVKSISSKLNWTN
ncbi:bifunctional glycosyltransferase/CDP-glycerol:glycerophosphate glycerophosphotransferase [Brevibacterium moorei]|uniref:bifunctional glycosyltransferase/CDP-glycerol:glycerophosphate glycerophosphotransferase n=1 Tax=Brevibacterium moorei TaxID=2968457 RepID=UPI00211C367F|nr:bifunctional glycosyltransferase family 2 protein/CDP-glycerol:glycerophosphate glycerophosphotransferase [Brevibacterium sp. 68QC2CO]MCQ9386235.1 bifunctional glycosyltransferase family 2 protein/CDP-glycerol:glycerophosphate glycerophosphotransferase [Brevibacterium sp. 68QC2CO]